MIPGNTFWKTNGKFRTSLRKRLHFSSAKIAVSWNLDIELPKQIHLYNQNIISKLHAVNNYSSTEQAAPASW